MSSFPDRFPHYAWTAAQSAHSYFVWSKVYACLGVTCHLHFWQNDRSLLRATAVTRGWNGHTKLTLEKKSLPPFLPGFELATFRSGARRSNQQAIPAPLFTCSDTLNGLNCVNYHQWQHLESYLCGRMCFVNDYRFSTEHDPSFLLLMYLTRGRNLGCV